MGDYTATIEVEGGTYVTLRASDPDCTISRNCGPDLATCTPLTVPDIPTRFSSIITQPFSGQFLVVTETGMTPP